MSRVGYNEPLYILPFDHRGVVPDQNLWTVQQAEPRSNERDRLHEANHVRQL
jgi:hypothetical protein